MRELEATFSDVLTVIGVHAGKYHTERETPQIALAARRLGVTHPVVNDRRFRLWRRYGVQAWPTLAFVGPDGEYLGSHAGEATAAHLADVLRELVARAESAGTLSRGPGPAGPSSAPGVEPSGVLAFPTGLAAAGADRLFVADTGHDRVLELALDRATSEARVLRAIGSGRRGHADGAFSDAQFAHPHGLAFDGATLWVADAGNHRIRAADLGTGTVRTVAGTGERGNLSPWKPVGARETPLASPLDLVLERDRLHVAMAGLHQLWSYDVREHTIQVLAGSGIEDLADGVLRGACLAQPSALAVAGDRLYFADAEASAVRWADLAVPFGERAVHTMAGTGLFDFGDKDGAGEEVRLQHPSALAVLDDLLVVADTYNHKLKLVDPESRSVRTWTSAAECGGLNEPEGLGVLGDAVIVADTNGHRLVIVEGPGEPVCREVEVQPVADGR